MEEDKIVKINKFKEEMKVIPIATKNKNVVNLQLRERMKNRMEQLRREYIEEQDIIGIFVSEFEDEYAEDMDIEIYARNLLERIRKGIEH